MSCINAGIEVRWKRLHDGAILPQYQTGGAAGFDLHSAESGDLPPGAFRMFDTGWSVAVPAGFEMQVRPRSGLAAKHGVTVLNSPGTIDSDYRGPLKVILVNHGKELFRVTAGDRIAQGIIAAVTRASFRESDSLDETARGENGFGSTGR
ncbi:MAG: dUTP diphosphatase [Nitrospirae bacterium]|nr:dUTP diphosphatase [Nitrospirota bacterium]